MLLPLARLRHQHRRRLAGLQRHDCGDDLYQIVFNLTENAIKYNRQDGWVGVSVRRAIRWSCASRTAVQASRRSPWSAYFQAFLPRGQGTLRAAGSAELELPSCTTCRAQLQHHHWRSPAERRHDLTVRFPHFDLEEDEMQDACCFAAPACAAVRLCTTAPAEQADTPVFLLLPLCRGRLWRRGRRDRRAAPLEPDAGLRTVAAIPERARLAGLRTPLPADWALESIGLTEGTAELVFSGIPCRSLDRTILNACLAGRSYGCPACSA